MADAKISALTNLTAADPTNDMIPIVDVSDTPPASGNTKRISINNILSSSPTASGALTVTGLVTAGSATITGDLTVDTSTLKVDSTNDRVGIGTITPNQKLDVLSAAAEGTIRLTSTIDGSNASPKASSLSLRSGSASVETARIASFNRFANVGGGDLVFSTADTSAVLQTRATIDSRGNLLVGVTSANANGGVLQLKSGITFPATQVAASDANTLDDYEEGTFTPTITSGATLVAYGTQSGSYTKVGRLVTIIVHLSTTAATVNGSQLTIAGLPFASSDFSSGVIGYSNNGFVSTPSGNKPNLYVSGSGVDFYTSSGSAFLGTTLGASSFDVRFTATYFV